MRALRQTYFVYISGESGERGAYAAWELAYIIVTGMTKEYEKRSGQSPPVRPVLVTGATGFLGGHLATKLASDFVPVRGTGRNLQKGQDLSSHGIDFRPVDLLDLPGMEAACDGVGSVVHCAALSSAWGTRRDFYKTNVIGTANVVSACLQSGATRLVYISSPSVMSRLSDGIGLAETSELPDSFVSFYSQTKKQGEDIVRAASDEGLETVILRPKAIYGPLDTAILPRLIKAASTTGLPLIGSGDVMTNLTYVDDVVSAIRLALESPIAPGNTYLITGGEDVRIWDVVDQIAELIKIPVRTKRLSLKKAMLIAGALEFIWRAFRLRGEPPLTRYTVSIWAFSQTYDISASRRDLGYEPRTTTRDGIRATLRHRTANTQTTDAKANPTIPRQAIQVPLSIYRAGWCRSRERFFRAGGSWASIRIPAMFAVMIHPTEGPILFDTGYSPRFYNATRNMPFSLYRLATPVTIPDDETAVSWVRELEIDPVSIKWIILSHFDPDHYGGLKDFPTARIVCSVNAWQSVVGKTGLAALCSRILPELLPDDIAGRLWLIPDTKGTKAGLFPVTHDLFSDSSVLLVNLPGHAAGHIGALVSSDGSRYLLAGDACWTIASLQGERYRGGLHRRIAVDRDANDRTFLMLKKLKKIPGLTIVPAHCPIMMDHLSAGRRQG